MTRAEVDFANVSIEKIEALCWDLLEEGTSSAASPMRLPVLATASSEGIDARVLVLRNVHRSTRQLEFHTDLRSAKVQHLEANPSATWVFYDAARKLQLKIKSRAYLCQDREVVRSTWESLSVHTRRAYCQELEPGTPVAEIIDAAPCPHVIDPDSGRLNFAIYFCDVYEIEWLKLSRAGHRRALISLSSEGWSSTWIMP